MHKSLLILFLSVAVLACTNMEEASPFRVEQSSFISTKVSNDYSFNRDDLDNDYFIKDEDINDYIKFKSLNDDKEIHVKEINPFDFQGAILFYVINYEDGWEIISADKRTPFLLAEGETGSFTMKDYDATPWGTWMFSIGLDVLNTRLNGIDASFEENENLKFWTLITKPEIILGAPSDSIVPSELVPDGHYELISTYTMTDYDYITINHLTSTKWSQSNNNCNYYVPYRTDYSSLKAPAGCVAISGAQMLYYLHNEIGVPSAAPNSAYCYGNVNSYQMGQSGSSTTIWSQMTTYGDIYTAILIANAGSCVGMDYGNEGSGANTSDLVDNFFGSYGIDCSYSNYDTNAIRSQIINRRMPIIVRAGSLELFDTWYNSHSFIIDGANYTRNKTIYYYEWVYDVEPGAGSILPEPPHPYTVETYSFNSVEFIKMNWGWGGRHNNESFSPGGDWVINDNGLINFQYNRKMISGFCAN